MPKTIPAFLGLAIAATSLPAAPARSADADRALLSTFCDAGNIKGATCRRANGYPNAGRRACNVALREERYSGKFLGAGNLLLVVFYDSGCEAHTTDNGGAVVFETAGGEYTFRSFQPGMLGSECITLPKNEQQDALICLTGHMGQGILESAVAQMVFKEDARKRINMSLDVVLSAEDSEGAYGSNTVTCNESFKVFDVSRLSAGPRPKTVTIEATYADAATIKTACGEGFPRPPEALGDPPPGDAYVAAGHRKSGKLIIDLATRKVVPQ
jgi:hypothetical protein